VKGPARNSYGEKALYTSQFHGTHDELLLIAVVAKLDVAPV